MLNLKNKNKFLFAIIFCLASFFAGAINGFVGTGGGIIFVYMLALLTNNDTRDNFATSLFATVPISIIGFVAYFRAGSVDYSTLGQLSLPAIVGGVTGAFLTDKLGLKWLKLAFAILVAYSGINMIIK
ncbi:MAG: sulfite exporter TauE/SafE family protein [Clostridia bacterium]|nr:sulfite exporter TauE/SafE family protein [Clostridia bacterium]